MRVRRVSDLVFSPQVARLVAALQQASLAQQVVKGGHRAGRSVEATALNLFPLPANASVRRDDPWRLPLVLPSRRLRVLGGAERHPR